MIYLFHGENDYLIRRKIKSLAKEMGAEIKEEEKVGENFRDQLGQMGLFGERLVFVVRGRLKDFNSLFPGGTSYWANIAKSQGAHLIFWERKLDRRLKAGQWLLRNAQVKEFAPLCRTEAQHWVNQWAAQQGGGERRITPQAIQALLDRHGSNLYLLESELKKLLTYIGQGQVGLKEVKQLSFQSVEEKIFTLADLVGENKTLETLVQLEKLLSQKQDPWFIWAMIARQLRLLAHFLIESKLTGQPPFVVKKIRKQALNWNLSGLKAKLAEMVRLEYQVKQGLLGIESSLFLFCAGLSSRAGFS